MNKSVEHAISYLERDIAEWENIARFFQQHNATLTDNERVESGEQVQVNGLRQRVDRPLDPDVGCEPERGLRAVAVSRPVTIEY